MSHRPKAAKEIAAEAERLGYALEGLTAGRHYKWRHRSGFLVITGSSIPTDRHRRNAISELRKHVRRAGEQI